MLVGQVTSTDIDPAIDAPDLATPVIGGPGDTAPPRAMRAVRLTVAGVSARYGAVTALDDVSLEVATGEIVALLGPSGSGKSTLLRLIAGLERPASGRIMLEGVEVAGPRRFVEPEQRRAGMVFQDYALFPHLTIGANVAFGLRGRPRADVGAVVGAWLDRLDLSRFTRSYPHMLSGGERQRAALARALAPAPQVLLMDEPFSSLDDRLRDRVRDETLRVLRDTRTTTIVVTHDPDEAMRIADRIVLLCAGRVVQSGTPADLYERPSTLFAARFFSDLNELSGVCRERHVETPIGRIEAPDLRDGMPALVCIRPEHVRVSETPTSRHGRLVRSTFLGPGEQLEVAIAGLEATLVARTRSRTGRKPGDLVYVDVSPRDALLFAHDRDRRAPRSME